MPELPDDPITDLLRRVASQDRAAFQSLYTQAAPKLTGVLTRILGNRSEVDDAIQEVFIRVWQRAAQFDPEKGRGMSWLVAVARNHALDRLRRRPQAAGMWQEQARDAEGQDPLERIADTGPNAEQLAVRQDEARRVLRCLDEQEAERAAAIRGAYLEGASYQVLSERLDIPLNTVRTWLRRGLLALKECLDR